MKYLIILTILNFALLPMTIADDGGGGVTVGTGNETPAFSKNLHHIKYLEPNAKYDLVIGQTDDEETFKLCSKLYTVVRQYAATLISLNTWGKTLTSLNALSSSVVLDPTPSGLGGLWSSLLYRDFETLCSKDHFSTGEILINNYSGNVLMLTDPIQKHVSVDNKLWPEIQSLGKMNLLEKAVFGKKIYAQLIPLFMNNNNSDTKIHILVQ